MNIPEKVKIGGYTFDVDWVEEIEGKKFMAEMDYENLKIRLVKGYPNKIIFSNFIHEVLEAFKRIYTIKIGHSTLERYEGYIVQFLVDNYNLDLTLDKIE